MEAKELYKTKEPATTSEYNYKRLFGLLLFVVTLTSCLFLASTIIESTMNYNSERAHILSYFTIQSNIIVTIWMIALALYILTNKKIYKFSMDSNFSASVTTYILVTGFIYWLVLVPIYYSPDAAWLFSTSNIWLHTLTPITSVIMLTFIKSKTATKPKPKFIIFFFYPILYIIFGIINAINNVFLYPMFNPNLLDGWIGVGICLAAICAIFTVLYLFLLYGIKRHDVRPTKK